MGLTLEEGARLVVERWCRVQPGEKVLIISDERHVEESMALWRGADSRGAEAALLTVPADSSRHGALYGSMAGFSLQSDVIIGATSFSLITHRVTRQVLEKGGRFLSLPLSSNNGRSVLTFDFMGMDPEEAERAGAGMLARLERAERVRVATALGTKLEFGKRGRRPGIFTGLAARPGQIGSSSFEIYLAIEEDATEGFALVDGSLGYLGRPGGPVGLTFRSGRLTDIQGEAGAPLRAYMDAFGDPGIYVAGELGIGLNRRSRCLGNCYIEDESAFSTFHIGMGRNLALGGVHDAAGHFDLVFKFPTIYADDVLIMRNGEPAV